MKKVLIALSCAGAALALAGTAGARVIVGVNDDAGKYEQGASWFYPTMAATGLDTNAITLRWDETQPTAIPEQALIAQAIAKAKANGVAVTLDIYPMHSRAFTGGERCAPSDDPESCGDAERIRQFGEWAGRVARTFPTVHEFVVMNECNQPLFVNPQWNAAGENQSAAICGRALLAAYDAIKGVDRNNFVWGVGLSPRGNDRPYAKSNASTSPVRFIAALGAWFRAYVQKTGRTAPLMDGFDFHPYPVPQSLPFVQGYASPTSASVTNLPRIYEAFYAAFDGTSQRTIGQQSGGGLPVSLNETGIQTDSTGHGGYTGTEVSATPAGGVLGEFATEAYQADWYVRMLDVVACDPNVKVVNIFHLIDETNLAGWQAGLYFADRTPKQSAAAVLDWLGETHGHCRGEMSSWTPSGAAALQPAIAASAAGTKALRARIAKLKRSLVKARGALVRLKKARAKAVGRLRATVLAKAIAKQRKRVAAIQRSLKTVQKRLAGQRSAGRPAKVAGPKKKAAGKAHAKKTSAAKKHPARKHAAKAPGAGKRHGPPAAAGRKRR